MRYLLYTLRWLAAKTHQGLGYDGKPFTQWKSGRREPKTYRNYNVDQPYGIFSADNYYPDAKIPRNGPYLYGCIAYVLPAPKLRPFGDVFRITWGRERYDGRIENCLAYTHPAVKTAGSAFGLFQFRGKKRMAGYDDPVDVTKTIFQLAGGQRR